MKIDLEKFKHSLPYASELSGIYQPLLGWRSRLRSLELSDGIASLKRRYLDYLKLNTDPQYVHDANAPAGFQVSVGKRAKELSVLDDMNGIVARKVSALVAEAGWQGTAWKKYTTESALNEILSSSTDEIKEEVERLAQQHDTRVVADPQALLSGVLARESTIAGALQRLGKEHSASQIAALMRPADMSSETPFFDILGLTTPAQSDLAAATISPLGLIRLYRQYFFEFDTFLGPPVQHLWLSPGGVVELVEVSTRRVLVERSTELAFESSEKAETSSNVQDEISDAVRSENAANTKLGVTVNSSASYGVGFVSGSTTVGSNFNIEQSSKNGRENTQRSLRQQTQKLASEIRKSFKSSFKTVTETIDTTSRRYVINNTTQKLINYELRRKMRQVGVQVQDVGVQLCWQAYVDLPGHELGLGRLIHVASPADLQGIKEPDAPAWPANEIKDKPITPPDALHFGIIRYNPMVKFEQNDKRPPGKFIQLRRFLLNPPAPGYVFSRAEVTPSGAGEWSDLAVLRAYPADSAEAVKPPSDMPDVQMIPTGDSDNPTEPDVRSIAVGWVPAGWVLGDGNNYYWNISLTVFWKPSRKYLNDLGAAYKTAMAKFNVDRERTFREALYKAARDRIKAAGEVQQRKFEDLREEERIVVYRNMIRKLLTVAGITDANANPKVRHLFAELVQSMFDVDQMLYFVAPEWWTPRQKNPSHQHVGLPASNTSTIPAMGRAHGAPTSRDYFDPIANVDWGGFRPLQDYYITEESARAPLGSSLGWVLQLDGDNLRNAFLNAPWVKAVIPIRAGHEWKALEWLSSKAIEGSDGLEDSYQASDATEKAKILAALKKHVWDDPELTTLYGSMVDPDKVRIIDAIRYLILYVQERNAQSLKVVRHPEDPKMAYLPTDEVFERGFDPLQGGFKAVDEAPPGSSDEAKPCPIFAQWIEILPTDQIVPVEVEYDPKTGMQV
jgi:hypothetical protein